MKGRIWRRKAGGASRDQMKEEAADASVSTWRGARGTEGELVWSED